MRFKQINPQMKRQKMVTTPIMDKMTKYGTKYCSPIFLIEWLQKSFPGDDFIYAIGDSVYECDLAEIIRKFVQEGDVIPLQKKENGTTYYMVRKRDKRKPFEKPWVFKRLKEE